MLILKGRKKKGEKGVLGEMQMKIKKSELCNAKIAKPYSIFR